MNINPVFNYTSFGGYGKPLDLKYVLEKRAYLLPDRVRIEAEKLLASGKKDLPSLYDLHKSLYAGLLKCTTLEMATGLYHEFSAMNKYKYVKSSVNSNKCPQLKDENFALNLLKEIWGNLKTKEEVAKQFKMGARSSLDYVMEKINFVSFNKNYKTLLKSSDKEMHEEIASKTRKWNEEHPDLMYAKNKHAAKAHKLKRNRKAQSERIKAYDKEHPERKKKIGAFTKRVWELCPEIRTAMSEFSTEKNTGIKRILTKKYSGESLTKSEKEALLKFYKSFWNKHPEYKEIYKEACNKVSEELKKAKKRDI